MSKFTEMMEFHAGVELTEESAGVVRTQDTIENFFQSLGRRLKRDGSRPAVPFEREGEGFYRWENVQANGAGTRRGDFWVYDAGDYRLAYFQN